MTRSVLVTGGASGIGRAAALLLAREGAAVTVVDRAADAADNTAREITSAGGSAIAASADVGNEGDVAAAVRSAVDAFGGLDGVVTSAGVFHGGDLKPLGEVELDDFLFVLQVNLAGTWRTPEAQERIRRIVPLQRVAEPEEIASVAAFLLSDGAAHLTGQTIAVDGGTTIA